MLQSVNGLAVAKLPAGAAAQVRASTLNGDIETDFGLEVRKSSYTPGKSIAATIGPGGAQLTMKTVNGGIQLQRQ